MLTPELIRIGMQCRLWRQKDLAAHAGLTEATIARALSGNAGVFALSKIFEAFKQYPAISNFESVCRGNDQYSFPLQP